MTDATVCRHTSSYTLVGGEVASKVPAFGVLEGCIAYSRVWSQAVSLLPMDFFDLSCFSFRPIAHPGNSVDIQVSMR